MKTKLFLLIISCLTGSSLFAVDYNWTGATSTDYATATNWSPTRTTPATGDNLIIDGASVGANVVIYGFTVNQTINSLTVKNNCSVKLWYNVGNTTARTLTLDATSNALNIETGSTLDLGRCYFSLTNGASFSQLTINSAPGYTAGSPSTTMQTGNNLSNIAVGQFAFAIGTLATGATVSAIDNVTGAITFDKNFLTSSNIAATITFFPIVCTGGGTLRMNGAQTAVSYYFPFTVELYNTSAETTTHTLYPGYYKNLKLSGNKNGITETINSAYYLENLDISTMTGSYTCTSNAATFNFIGTTPQTMLALPSTINTLGVDNPGGVTLANDITLSTNLRLIGTSKLTIGNYNLTVPSSIASSSATAYIVTNGTGVVSRTFTTNPFAFPIGSSSTSYDPVTITPSTTGVTFSTRVGTTLSGCRAAGKADNAKEWIVTPSEAVTATVKMSPSLSTHLTTPIIGSWNGASFDDVSATLTGASNPYSYSASLSLAAAANKLVTGGSTTAVNSTGGSISGLGLTDLQLLNTDLTVSSGHMIVNQSTTLNTITIAPTATLSLSALSNGILNVINPINLGGTVNIKVTGVATPGTDYDQIIASNSAAVITISGTLALTMSPLTPADNTSISIIKSTGASGTISGTFSSVTGLASGWSVVYTSNSVNLRFNKSTPTVTVNIGTYIYNGSPVGPNSLTSPSSPSASSITYSYSGSGYGPSATRPTIIGSYQVTATVNADDPYYYTATSGAVSFEITAATITLNSGATAYASSYTTPQLANSNIVVLSGSFEVDQSTITTKNVTVAAGAKLKINSTNTFIVTGDLMLKADNTGSFSLNIGDGTLTVNGVMKYLRTIDDKKWYFLSFPCDVTLSTVTGTPALGTLGTNWFVRYYDGNHRGIYGTSSGSNWIPISNAAIVADPTLKLNKNQGYIFGLADGKADTELSYTLDKTYLSTETSKNITVSANTGAAPITNHGWNLIGQPYLAKYLPSGAVGADSYYIYVYDGAGYTPYPSGSAPIIDPMSAYFVQASSTLATGNSGTGISFALNARQSISSSVDNDTSDKLRLNFTCPTGVDNTNLILDSSLSTEYEIGKDLEKWINTGSDKPQVYTLLNGVSYAYNALPMSSIVNLPIGFCVNTAGTSTISVDKTETTRISKLLLTDYGTNPATVTDLFESNYTFTTAAGVTNNRFKITAINTTTLNSNISNETSEPRLLIQNSILTVDNLIDSPTVRVYDALGRMVSNLTHCKDLVKINLLAKGIYTVLIENGRKSWVEKVVN